MEHILDGFLGAFIGAIVGGWAVLHSVTKQHENDKRLAKLETQEKIKGVLQAIYYEIKVLGDVYNSAAGTELAKVGESGECRVLFSLTQDYFIVYPANCDVIGQILDDSKLVEAIINTYNTANFLIELYRINNLLLEQQARIRAKLTDNTGYGLSHMSWETQIVEHSQLLRNSARELKTCDKKLKDLSAELLSRIENYAKNH